MRFPAGAMAFALALAFGARAEASPQSFTVLEDQLSTALEHYDAKAVDALWDDRFVFVFPNGHVSHKAERLKGIVPPKTDGPQLVSHNDSVDVQYEDAGLAVVLVRSTWRFGDQPGDPYLATHVWVRRGERWRLLSAQVAQVKP